MDAALPLFLGVIADEHVYGVADALWARFEEHDRTVEGASSRVPFDRE